MRLVVARVRVGALVLFAGAALVVAGSGQAHASAAPTLSGPSVVKYNQTVVISGTTPTASEQVVVYVKDPTMSSYLVLARPTSDASGQFTVTYVAQMSESLYATAAGLTSPTITVPIVTASCSVSSTAVSSPLPSSGFQDAINVAEFTANRGQVWAGIAEADGRFATIVWRPGVPVRVLGVTDLSNAGYDLNSAWASGISPHGYVVSTSTVPAISSPHGWYYMGYVWINYVAHRVAGASNWSSVQLSGISATGTIIGTVQIGKDPSTAQYAVVAWTEDGQHYMVIKQNLTSNPGSLIDGAGDVAYNVGSTTVVRVGTTGQILTVLGSPNDTYSPEQLTVGGPGNVFYGLAENSKLASWTVPQTPATLPVYPQQLAPTNTANPPTVLAVSPRGDLLLGQGMPYSNPPKHVITPEGAFASTPQTYSAIGANAGEAFDGNGTLAYTGTGGRVRFLTCS